MKIKFSQPTPRKPEGTIITPKIIFHTLEEIYLLLDVTHVMRKDTYLNNFLTKGTLTRKTETKEDIMLMLQRMMNLHQREPDMRLKILQARKNMFRFPLSSETLVMDAMIDL